MARNRNRDEDEYRFIASKDNLEAEAQFAKKLLDDIVDGFEKKINDRASKWDKKFAQNASRFFADDYEGRQRHRENDNNSGEKMSFGAQAIKNLVKETTKGGKFSTDKRENVNKILLEVAGIFERTAQIYIAKPINEAISSMSNAYESNYSAIAGRMGTDRKATHRMLRSAVDELNRSSVKSVVNINKELIPAIRAATEKGFKGSEAAAVGMSNAIDQKIMPWLDTQSDGWTQLQFTLDKNALKQLKASQLAMQETRAGNRLLQSGIINQFTNDMIPTLTNIEYNTSDTEQFSDEMKATMTMMVDKFNYTPQEAYNYAKKELDIKNNPFKYITDGNVLEKQKSVAYAFGNGASDSWEVERRMNNYTEGMNDFGVGAFVAKGLINSIDGTATTESGTRQRKMFNNNPYDYSVEADASLYDKTVETSKDKVTKTQAHDNWMQNTTTGLTFGTNNFNHGVDMLENIATGVKAIIGILAAWGAGKLLNKFGDRLVSKLGGELFKKAGGKLAEEAGKKVVTEAGSGLLSRIGQTTIKAGAALPLAAGTAIGAYGISAGKKDKEEGHNVRGNISIGGGIAAATGGAIAGGTALAASAGIAVGAANIWNPIGWGLLLAGGVAVAATAIHRFSNNMSEAAKEAKENYKNVSDAYAAETKDRKEKMRSVLDQITKDNATEEDLNDARKTLIEQGMVTEDQARTMNKDSLASLTSAYLDSANKISGKEEAVSEVMSNALAADADSSEKATKKAISEYLRTINPYTSPDAVKNSSGVVIDRNAEGIWTNSKAEELNKLIVELIDSNNNFEGKLSKENVDFLKAYREEYGKGGQITGIERGKAANILFGNTSQKGVVDTESIVIAAKRSQADSFLAALPQTETAQAKQDKTAKYQKALLELENQYNLYQTNPSEYGQKAVELMVDQFNILHENKVDPKVRDEAIAKGNLHTNDAKMILESLGKTVPEYRTGSDYITHDQFAILHKGEAVLTAADTSAAKRMSDASTISATDIVKAIQGQTKDIVEVLYTIITELQSGKTNEVFKTQGNDKDNSRLTQFFPKYNNTRNLYSV